MGDAKRGSSGRGGRRSLGRDFGSCCEEGGFASRRGRSPGYPRKRSRRWVRARRGGWRRRWWSPGTPRRRRSGGGGTAKRSRVRREGWMRRGAAAANRRPGGRDAEWARLRVVHWRLARVTAGRRGPFYSGPRLPWAPHSLLLVVAWPGSVAGCAAEACEREASSRRVPLRLWGRCVASR